MPDDTRNECPSIRTPSFRRRSVRPTAWVLSALLAFCATGLTLLPGNRDGSHAGKVRQAADAPPTAADTEALQERIADLDRQMDSVNAAMGRLLVVMQQRDELTARSVDRIAELHQDLNRLVLQMKGGQSSAGGPPADR